MVVDKFGRHQSAVSVRRETKRQLRDTVGFKITNDGHIDVENKKIRNLNEPDAAKDAVSLTYMQTHCPVSYTHLDVYKRQGNRLTVGG